MRLQLSKWGNSLAVRLPVECTRAAGLRDGDTVDAEVTALGEIKLTPTQTFDKAAFLERLRKQHAHRLRPGDALHLAVAREVGAKSVATLDGVMSANGERIKMRVEAI